MRHHLPLLTSPGRLAEKEQVSLKPFFLCSPVRELILVFDFIDLTKSLEGLQDPAQGSYFFLCGRSSNDPGLLSSEFKKGAILLSFSNHLFIVSPDEQYYVHMQHTEQNIRTIRDKMSRIGISEKKLDDETILASYGINKFGQLYAIPKVSPPVQ